MRDESHEAMPKGYRHIGYNTTRDSLPKGFESNTTSEQPKISKDALPKEPNTQSQKNNNIRKGWTEIEKEQVRIRQEGKCQKCGRPPPRWEYHHKDGNRSNDSISNCQGLCPNCHSVKTNEE